jgi:hypothetical protein
VSIPRQRPPTSGSCEVTASDLAGLHARAVQLLADLIGDRPTPMRVTYHLAGIHPSSQFRSPGGGVAEWAADVEFVIYEEDQ